MTGRHCADDALSAGIRDWYAAPPGLPVTPPPLDSLACVRCGAPGAVRFGSKYACGECGLFWQEEPITLDATSRHAVRRALDEVTE
jgi:hypothetical protein